MGPSLERPAFRWTNAALSGGTLLAGAALLVGLGLALLGGPTDAGDPRRLDEVLRSAAALRPWGWSMVGLLVLIATPAAGLATTFLELRPRHPRSALLALAVLGVLVGAAVVAFGALA